MELGYNSLGVIVFGKVDNLLLGDSLMGLDKVLRVPAGPYVQGRVVNAIGRFVDGKN